jgi:hypothetical protein
MLVERFNKIMYKLSGDDPLKKNRVMLGFAYLLLILYQAAIFLLFHFLYHFIRSIKIFSIFISGAGQMVQFALIIFLIMCIVNLAESLNRTKVWWSIGFPFSFLLLFLGKADHPFKLPSSNTYTSYGGKTCSRCGKAVSLSAKAGDVCPHCRAHWDFERKK